VRALGRRAVEVPTDIAQEADCRRLVDTAMRELGRVDVLVNNAATPGGLVSGPLAEADEAALLEDINTKVLGYLRCAKAVAPHLQRRGWGRIINIGGLSGRRSGNISGLRNAAVVHLTKTLSDQLGPHGITVNLVHPGTTRTERTDQAAEQRAASNAIRRIVDAHEIAQVVAFLASTKAANVTGVAIDASGGSIPVMFQ
jgi:NAD(P)-dependent dehydrogenase (short-subunit alcohol dehydrogenase family)